MTGFLRVKNFDRFQHYKDRSPPWIKLYNSLLDDYAFTKLPDASRSHLLAIWLLASRTENRIPCDAEWIRGAIKASGPVDLEILVNAGFLVMDQDCSILLADRKQDARPEKRERERESRVEESPIGDSCPLREAFDAWNAIAEETSLPVARVLTAARKAGIKSRLADCGGIEEWRMVIAKVRDSPFLRGVNDRGWKADLDFLLQPKSFNRLMDGGYGDRKPSTGDRIAAQHAAIDRALGVDDGG